MTPYEIIVSFFTCVALIISVLAYLKASTSATRANEIALGNIELYISERITATKEKVSDIYLKMAPLAFKDDRDEQDEKLFAAYVMAYNAAIENNLNAYEDACSKFLDNKVDRLRFEKSYKTEIRQLVENEELKSYFDGVTSKYKAILKVYNNWENLEK